MTRDCLARGIEFVNELARKRQLDEAQLGKLPRRMVKTKDVVEANRLKEEIVRGFYGGDPHA